MVLVAEVTWSCDQLYPAHTRIGIRSGLRIGWVRSTHTRSLALNRSRFSLISRDRCSSATKNSSPTLSGFFGAVWQFAEGAAEQYEGWQFAEVESETFHRLRLRLVLAVCKSRPQSPSQPSTASSSGFCGRHGASRVDWSGASMISLPWVVIAMSVGRTLDGGCTGRPARGECPRRGKTDRRIVSLTGDAQQKGSRASR